MELFIAAIRWLHIVAGMLALFLAPAAMLTAKGGRAHRRWGQLYFWAMAGTALTAALLAFWLPNAFLVLLAVFSFYMAFAGYRTLFRKRPALGERATAVDWTAAMITLAASAGMIVMGIVRLGLVPIVFGGLGAILAGNDLRRFIRPPTEPMDWWFSHMGRMLGSYIATVSAFSVVNLTMLPTPVRWLWPTVLGVPLIVLWIRYYRIRFRRGPAPEVRQESPTLSAGSTRR